MPNMLDMGQGPAPAAQPSSLDQTIAQFDKMMEMKGLLSKVLGGLGVLTKMGDTVTQDDVVEEAGKLVAAGLTPKGMATMLSEMPEKPEAIAQWLAGHEQQVQEKEGQLDQALRLIQHHMGVQAMKELQGLPQAAPTTSPEAMEGPQPEGAAPASPANALAPQE